MDLTQFATLMSKRAAALPANVQKAKRDIATIVAINVIDMTPVDEGHAISNWQVSSEGNMPRVQPHYPGTKGSSRTENSHATITKAVIAIQSIGSGKTIHIGNGIDYIADLNNGTSTQAPRGFVQTAILIAKNHIPKVKVID